jgi:hypothetical protein
VFLTLTGHAAEIAAPGSNGDKPTATEKKQ